MDVTTLHNPDVQTLLDNYVCIKFQAEHPEDPAMAAILSRFGVIGMPTCVVLNPSEEP